MIRKILCNNCADKFYLYPEDSAAGWRMRRVPIKARKPSDHHIEIISTNSSGTSSERIHLSSLECDNCGSAIADGTDCMAITMYYDGQEPLNWEQEYSQQAL